MTHAGIAISRGVPILPVGASLAPPVFAVPPTPTGNLSPLYATLTKNLGSPANIHRSLTILCRGAACWALSSQASNTGGWKKRLAAAARAHPHTEPNSFKRNAYKNRGVLVES
jgi:hypothetical protein